MTEKTRAAGMHNGNSTVTHMHVHKKARTKHAQTRPDLEPSWSLATIVHGEHLVDDVANHGVHHVDAARCDREVAWKCSSRSGHVQALLLLLVLNP